MKHISHVDNVANLQALIKYELRELGIKVPKPKKTKRGTSKQNQDVLKSQIFGNYLAAVPCVHVPECGYVAKFLVDAEEIISENIDCEGVFRKSGSVSRQKEIKQQLENGSSFCGANVYDVTALVKQFFRELPEPLFTSVYHDTFIRCYQLDSEENATRAILLLCLLLPPEHISTLQYIMKLLAKIAANSGTNKMDSMNLAVILAPNIMHVNSKSETMKSCEEKLLQVQTAVVELLIKHADEVGMVGDDIVEKTAFMSEVFSTDDELDASEDNLDDTKETRKKEKKRKRSGSFQGFVSSIAQSITKWRRSTDGKTNTSGMSHGSNASHISATGHGRSGKDSSYCNQGYQFSGMDATPVMRRNMPHMPATEGRAFSASKKRAILNQLPQKATLASTPFTPASCKKPGGRRGVHETPSMPPRPYQTPRQAVKTRKKIALFSPASTTKKKRYSSTSNLSMTSGSKKASKPKGIFRRLSGSKGDQMFSDKDIGQQIGQRLAGSPTSTVSAPIMNTSANITSKLSARGESPITAIAQHSFSTSMYEQSMVSNFEDDRRSLNEGFIMTDEKDGDITRIMSEPAIASALDSGEYVMIGDILPGDNVSDSVILNESNRETPRGHSRSLSVDSTLDTSRKGSLKRGQPNSLKAGLLNGDKNEVQKLRRSFGFDKSDISYPIPQGGTSMEAEDQYVELNCSIDILCSDSKVSNRSMDNVTEDSKMRETDNNSPGSVSRTKSCTSLASNVTDKDMNEVEKETGYECDDESEAGFSTISGGTAMYISKSKLCGKPAETDEKGVDKKDENYVKKSLAQQKQESKDSLLSDTSSTVSPVFLFKEREMTRSISADSGKGSMCEEMQERGPDATLDSITSMVLDQKESPTKMTETEDLAGLDVELATPKANQSTDNVFNDSLDSDNGEAPSTVKKMMISQKSVSTQNLRESEHTPSRVSRSKSLLETSLAHRKMSVKPNLQISAETHKLLARAGYINEPKTPKPNTDFDDFAVPGSFPFIKQAEDFNPRRESIIALQKNNAGHVRNNIRQFDKITRQNDVETRRASPLRFPNSTTRKMRTPVSLNKNLKDIDAIKHCLHGSKGNLQVGTARVPISTSLIKPSDPDQSFVEEKPSGLKRKPSIYYADKEGAKPPPFKIRSISRVRLSTTEEDIEDEDDVFRQANNKDSFNGKLPELNQSLLDTINDVCTPLSEKVKLSVNSDRVDRKNKENKCKENGGSKMPEIKPAILSTPCCLDTVKLRTASNKTPVELFKTGNSPRSPIKPLKRLGSSPHSPRSRGVHSPKLVKSNRRSLLSAVSTHDDELSNF